MAPGVLLPGRSEMMVTHEVFFLFLVSRPSGIVPSERLMLGREHGSRHIGIKFGLKCGCQRFSKYWACGAPRSKSLKGNMNHWDHRAQVDSWQTPECPGAGGKKGADPYPFHTLFLATLRWYVWVSRWLRGLVRQVLYTNLFLCVYVAPSLFFSYSPAYFNMFHRCWEWRALEADKEARVSAEIRQTATNLPDNDLVRKQFARACLPCPSDFAPRSR